MIQINRKTAATIFLVICAMAGTALPAYAGGVVFQPSSLPVQVRGEGLTEAQGAVVLQATGSGTILAGSSATVAYSGTITNASSFTGLNGLTCSIMGVPSCGPSLFSMSASGSQLTVSFTSAVTFNSGDYLEFTGVRMNVNSLGVAVTTVTATLSGTSSAPSTNPITFTTSSVAVANIVNPSVTGRIISTATAIQTCAVPAGETFQVRAQENYPAAITTLADEQAFSDIGIVSNGSLVNMVISNVPSGMAVMANSYTAVSNGITITSGNTSFGTQTGYAVSLNSSAFQTSVGSPLTFTFVVSGDSTSVVESFTVQFGIGLPNSGNNGLRTTASSLPALGTTVAVSAAVSLAPSSGVVSFATNVEGSGTVVTIGDCVTNIAFPYVSNQNGYDTSFSVANTSNDDLAFGAGAGASAQNGSCTLSLWPTIDTTLASSSPLGTPIQITTPVIPAGGVYAFAQSSTAYSGLTGYVIAVCRFLNAHAFAFLTNGFAQSAGPQLSHGYLGLILPNPIAGRTNPNGESGVH